MNIQQRLFPAAFREGEHEKPFLSSSSSYSISCRARQTSGIERPCLLDLALAAPPEIPWKITNWHLSERNKKALWTCTIVCLQSYPRGSSSPVWPRPFFFSPFFFFFFFELPFTIHISGHTRRKGGFLNDYFLALKPRVNSLSPNYCYYFPFPLWALLVGTGLFSFPPLGQAPKGVRK